MCILCLLIFLYSTYFISKNGHDEFPWLESLDNARDQIIIVGSRYVALEGNVGKIWFWCNVNCHVTALRKIQ